LSNIKNWQKAAKCPRAAKHRYAEQVEYAAETQNLKIRYLKVGINIFVEEVKLIEGRKRVNNPLFANDVVKII